MKTIKLVLGNDTMKSDTIAYASVKSQNNVHVNFVNVSDSGD